MWFLTLACTAGDGVLPDTGTPEDSGTLPVDPDVYRFTSALTGEDSVDYRDQVLGHLLIDDMHRTIGDLTDAIDLGDQAPADGDVEAMLTFYLDFDGSTDGQVPHDSDTELATTSTVYDDISTTGSLAPWIAGNDADGQTNDWTTGLVGANATSPEALVRDWIGELDDLAAARAAGEIPTTPDGRPIALVHVTADGRDLQVLLQTFLRGSIAYSQAMDDQLDHDWDELGLLADHTGLADGEAYTDLEHAWDEAFGHFGASRGYGGWTDEQIVGRALDVDEDGAIDLTSEHCSGHSVHAAERDLVAASDFTAQAFDGFFAGRWLLARSAGGWLQDFELQELMGYRDDVVAGWEGAIGATLIHELNATLQDTTALGTPDHVFEDHARHWSAAKGHALTLQFNPRSSVSDEDLATLHELLGDAPELDDVDAAKADLLAARTLVADAYGFEDVGDDAGEDGW
ncbi:MAG: DUF4856 domain-containing protein [Proteobacteria bacterium]|nr:DUF4856 domain-containing protein [Pseudomonadota bacterium]MCP4920837.1 DUF4856 domain-containing protein [Pseudomonadota bacterium]